MERLGLGDLVAHLEDGLDTWIGEGGVRLSGGQRRRVALGRVLLRQTPIIVLDEPTEDLDGESARVLLDAIFELTEGRTLVLITHRLDGLEGVDRVVVLERGRVVESGAPDELIAQGGRYAELRRAL